MYYKGKPGFEKEQVAALQELEGKLSDEQIDFITRTGTKTQEYNHDRFLYEPTQISMLAKAFQEGLSIEQISVFANSKYNAFQMMYPIIYCKDLSAHQIEQVMLGFENGLNAKQISAYNNPSLTPEQMKDKRLEMALKQEPTPELLAEFLILHSKEPLQDVLEQVNLDPADSIVDQAICIIKEEESNLNFIENVKDMNYEKMKDYGGDFNDIINNFPGNNFPGNVDPGDGGFGNFTNKYSNDFSGPGDGGDPGDDGAPDRER